uniref:helix-turn-helix domain-containing protein n=1 Tax=Arthrobacter sp. TaxID=1667 RepID=UPI00159ECE9B|nr:XRE family transcriptional regulator [Arthrobacter sp.]
MTKFQVKRVSSESGVRILTLRHLLGISQADLSLATGISQAQISLMERGERTLTPSAAQSIARVTETPSTFFEVEDQPLPGPLTYRKLASAGARSAVGARFNEIERIANHVGNAVKFTHPSLPRAATSTESVITGEDIELYAQATRMALGLTAEAPVLNLTRSMERKGIIVVPIADRSEDLFHKHEGLSRPTYPSHRPFITYVSGGSGDRERFSKAHELGHLVLHGDRILLNEKAKEQEANEFAGALLLPQKSIENEVSETLNLNGYLKLKATWGVSIQAIIARGYKLGLLSDSRRKSLMVQLSYKGWRKEEPIKVAPEEPILLRQMLTKMYGSAPYTKAAQKLGITPKFLQLWAPGAEENDVSERTARVTSREDENNNVVPLFGTHRNKAG